MCFWSFVVWRMGFARISAVLANSSSVFILIVVGCSGSVFSAVSTIKSLCSAMSFSICRSGWVGMVFS